ncbi:MAG: substrate-binding domain-containing protein [Chloroflexi bacterium]|nr:substrate-binding domain-containing protein [Chloroflexota bacterium]
MRPRTTRMAPRRALLALVLGLLALLACSPAPAAGVPPAGQAAPFAARGPDAAGTSPPRPLDSAAVIPRAQPGREDIVLATTTSTQDTGLLDVLVPLFEHQTGYRVKPIAVGSGQALALGARGEADVLLVHAPEAERAWMARGYGAERLLVMHNDFVVVGPPEDPAQVKGRTQVAAALRGAAEARAPFISRGDESGTHQLERTLWQAAGHDPRGHSWYVEAGQGMGATLNIANERRAYTLSDRATYLARRGTLQLDVVLEGAPELLNVYHVIVVDAARFAKVNSAGGRAFAAFLVSREAQDVIASFGVERYGQPLFVADAGKREEELGEAPR